MKSSVKITVLKNRLPALLLIASLAMFCGMSQSFADAGRPLPPPAAKTAPAAKQNQGVYEKVKTWVMEKWSEFRSSLPGAPANKVPATAQKGNQSGQNQTADARQPAQSQDVGTNNSVDPSSYSGGGDASVPQASQVPQTPEASQTANLPRAEVVTRSKPALKDLLVSESGVPFYTVPANAESIPRLDIGKEEKWTSARWALSGEQASFFEKSVAHQMESPALFTPVEMKALTKLRAGMPGKVASAKTAGFKQPTGQVSFAGIDAVSLALAVEKKIELLKYVPLTQDELRFLSGLLLFQQGDKCAVAIGLFHELSRSKGYGPEGNFYLAMCSKKLGLTTDFIDRTRKVVEAKDRYYVKRLLPEIPTDVPYEYLEPLGAALYKASSDPLVMVFDSDTTAGNINYIIANYGAQTGKFKIAAEFGAKVPEKHSKWAEAQFLMAIGEYQLGAKKAALQKQEELIAKLDSDKEKKEFQALVSLNLARMYFQERQFKQSQEAFLKVYKDHPLWLQSLQEMGWAQLMSGDYEGAIGNMYSVQSPYFQSVYKPESYVIRTIGYLNICQYGDAYRTLTVLEKSYRPWLEKMATFMKTPTSDYIGTVKKFMALKSASAEVDGLPSQIVREMARHKDFLNLQTALNRQVDELDAYKKLDGEVDKSLKRARWLVTNSRKRAQDLRTKIASIAKNKQLENNRLIWNSELNNELELLNGYFFEIDLYNEAKASLQGYKNEVVDGANVRIDQMKSRISSVLTNRLRKMERDLKLVLENNELLRYEVFAGSGENIRFQVSGGESANRVPADVKPASKTLQWDFDGEYWEDEVGHYRSSLKNNCPDAKPTDHAGL